jgi:amino acid transporter
MCEKFYQAEHRADGADADRIIGSGWLFGAWKAAKIAGPAAIVAWVIGAIVILAIALTYAELGAMFPESGGMVRYARYSHGALVGFVSAWANWIAIVSVIPIEAEAAIQYMSTWPYQWAHSLFVNGSFQPSGLILSALLVIVYFMLNYWGVKLFARQFRHYRLQVRHSRRDHSRAAAHRLSQ